MSEEDTTVCATLTTVEVGKYQQSAVQ